MQHAISDHQNHTPRPERLATVTPIHQAKGVEQEAPILSDRILNLATGKGLRVLGVLIVLLFIGTVINSVSRLF